MSTNKHPAQDTSVSLLIRILSHHIFTLSLDGKLYLAPIKKDIQVEQPILSLFDIGSRD